MTRPDETPMPDRLTAVLEASVPHDHTVKNHNDTAICGGPFDHDLKLLRRVFTDLRRSGMVALQNHKCCGSCASYDIACRVEAMDSLPQGAVYYCAQTARIRDEGYPFYLNFSQSGGNRRGLTPRHTRSRHDCLRNPPGTRHPLHLERRPLDLHQGSPPAPLRC